MHGLAKATELTEKKLGHYVTIFTVQSIRNVYRTHLATTKIEPLVELPAKPRGRPLYQCINDLNFTIHVNLVC